MAKTGWMLRDARWTSSETIVVTDDRDDIGSLPARLGVNVYLSAYPADDEPDIEVLEDELLDALELVEIRTIRGRRFAILRQARYAEIYAIYNESAGIASAEFARTHTHWRR